MPNPESHRTKAPLAEPQLASAVLMIRPTRFQSNPQTAASNRFQGRSGASRDEQQILALSEFNALAETLQSAGIAVVIFDDTTDPHTPDSIFPNNWVSFHADGRVVLYPMEAPNRRSERREDIVERLQAEYGFQVTDLLDLTEHEASKHFLEGTGSMVLDRANRMAYAGLSTRTQLDPLGDFAQRMDYDIVAFDAADRNGVPIYHTNVMMNIGEAVAVICDVAISDAAQRDAVLRQLQETGHDIIRLSYDQLDAFAGNMLELRGPGGGRIVAMSTTAFESLNTEQRDVLDSNGQVIHTPIDTIEKSAGGSVRCMLAEIHLPKNQL